MKKEQEKLPVDEAKESGGVSRRDFLVGTGTVVVGGAIGAGLLSSCKGDTTTVTQTTTKTVPTTVTAAATTITNTVTSTVGTGGSVTITQTVTKTIDGPGGAVLPADEPEETGICVTGGSCYEPVAIDTKHGKIVRMRPLHLEQSYTSAEIEPSRWTMSAQHRKTGETITLEPLRKSVPSYLAIPYKKRVYAPNRVRYPLKRIDWEPGGDPAKVNSQNRGISKFKRISWDEAAEIVAAEVKRIHEKYGLNGILDKSDSCHRELKSVQGGHCSIFPSAFLKECGGMTLSVRNADSWEGYYYGSQHVWGKGNAGTAGPANNLTIDLAENSDLLVYQGCDWDTTATIKGGWPSRVARWYNHLGIKQVYIAPDINFQQASNPDKWIPVIPGRDDALQCAIIYVWLTEDLWDQEYVETHVNVVNGRSAMEWIKDYILGRSDDMIPKTPAWAATRCGVKPWTIKALARQWGTKRTAMPHHLGGSYIRGPFTHECARFESIMLGMQGLGKPGVQQVGVYQGPKAPRQVNANTGSTAGTARWRGIGAVLFHPLPAYINQFVPKVKVPEAILDGHMESWGNTSIWAPVEDQFTKYIYPYPADDEVVDSREFRNPNGPPASEFHMIWQDHSCHIACWTDTNSYIHAIRSPKIECIVLQCIWMENDVLYADIVLPCSTNVEERDILGFGAEYAFTVYHEPIIQPVGESKSDYGIVVEVAKKLEKYGGRYEGLVNKLTGGKTDEEWCKAGFDASKIDTLETGITWDQLKEKGYWTAPVATDWYNDTRGLNGFYTDPEKNPIQLPSGKLEFYSERLKENFPDDEERGPYPKYQPGGPGMWHDESLVVEDGAERCKTYKLVMQAQHVRWRLQSQGDDVPWTREIPTCKILVDGYRYEPVWINPQDAETRGIKHGDLVKVWNDRATELGAAYVTHRIIPGAVHMDHGSRLDYISNAEEDYADRGKKWVNRSGTCNQLSPYPGLSRNAPGMTASSYLVNVDKLDPSEMQEWRDKYPESFSRAYDPDYGPLSTDEWVVKEGKQ